MSLITNRRSKHINKRSMLIREAIVSTYNIKKEQKDD